MSDMNSKIDAPEKDLKSVSQEALKDEEARKKLLGVVMQAMATVEAPIETIWRMIMSPHSCAALMTVLKSGLLEPLTDDKGPKSAGELSTTTGVDELLIVRLMRPLTALGIFKEVNPQTYASTPISELLMTPPLFGGYQYMYTCVTRSLANMPFYLERTGWKNVSGAPGPFQDNFKTDMGMFQWLQDNPSVMTQFNNFMSGQRMHRKDWYDFFPVDDILLQGVDSKDPDAVLFVDIGGGEGHDTQAFHRRFPNHPGKVVLQDLPAVIDNIKELDSAVVRMKHDFFKPQQIHGARGYYFRSIFHDWPDSDCINIMKQAASAMQKDYSKLLIFEWIMPPQNTPLYPALLDINMMAVLNGMERTREQWTALLDKAGLKVVKFWTIADDVEGLIEAELK